jgi:DNA-binding CsgD family transcriptional regulator
MIASQEEAYELVGRFYDAAFDPTLWPLTLTRLTDAMGGANAFRLEHDPLSMVNSAVAPHYRPDYLQIFCDDWLKRDHYATGNVLAVRTFAAPSGRPLGFWDLVARDELVATDFYNEWWRPQKLGLGGVFVKWTLLGGRWGFCCIHPPKGRNDFDARQTTLFALLAPHIERAAELQRRLLKISIELELARAGLNPPDTAVIITDLAARVVFANNPAAELIRDADGLLVDKSRLSAFAAGAAAAIGRLIAESASTALNRSAGGTLRIPRGGRSALDVQIAPFRGLIDHPDRRHLPCPAVIVVITDPEQQQRRRLERLRSRFGLTAAEAAFSLEVARGDGREAAARRVGISLGTARTHLQRIFDKTGVCRQAELVRLVIEGGNAGRAAETE